MRIVVKVGASARTHGAGRLNIRRAEKLRGEQHVVAGKVR